MSFIIRCDAPGCTNKATMTGTLPAGWTQSHNRYGTVIHACATAGHLAAAQIVTSNTWLANIV